MISVKNSVFTLILFNLISVAHAQNALSPSIQAKQAQAQAELKLIDAKIDAAAASQGTASQDPASSWACQMQILKLQRTYASWFIENADQFNENAIAVDAALKEVKTKIAQVQKESIAAVAVQGQQTETVQVSFKEIIAYLRLLNGRMKSCGRDQISILMKEQQDPKTNALNANGKPVHVGHGQIVDVLEKMTSNLNASLKEATNSYQVAFNQGACGFELNLQATIKVGKYGRREMKVSLVQPVAGGDYVDPNKWSAEYVTGQKVGKYSLSGNLRYLQMHNESVSAACMMPKWASISTERLSQSVNPYYSFAQADAEFSKFSQIGTINPLLEQAELRKKIRLEMKDTEYCKSQSEQGDLKGKALFVDGIDMSERLCLYSPVVLQNGENTLVFAVEKGGYIYYRSVAGKISEWSHFSMGVYVMQLLSAQLIDGVAAVVLVDNTAKLHFLNSAGQTLNLMRANLPPPSARGAIVKKLELRKTPECDKRSIDYGYDVFSVFYDGEDYTGSICVSEAQVVPFYNDVFIFGIGANHHNVVVRTLNTTWTQINNGISATKLISVSFVDGVPMYKIRLKDGSLKSYNITGKEVN